VAEDAAKFFLKLCALFVEIFIFFFGSFTKLEKLRKWRYNVVIYMNIGKKWQKLKKGHVFFLAKTEKNRKEIALLAQKEFFPCKLEKWKMPGKRNIMATLVLVGYLSLDFLKKISKFFFILLTNTRSYVIKQTKIFFQNFGICYTES
jgi:hypothetical protein